MPSFLQEIKCSNKTYAKLERSNKGQADEEDDEQQGMPLVDHQDDLKGLIDSCAEIYERDSNFLVATWFDTLGYNQRAFDDKLLFFNSESILASKDVLEHFSLDNKKMLSDKNIEFVCKKGREGNSLNQDNFFCISVGKNKIFGVFDGHGPNGNLASSFAMGAMVDYI